MASKTSPKKRSQIEDLYEKQLESQKYEQIGDDVRKSVDNPITPLASYNPNQIPEPQCVVPQLTREQQHELDRTKAELDRTKTELSDTKAELKRTKSELDDTKSILDATRQQVSYKYEQISNFSNTSLLITSTNLN